MNRPIPTRPALVVSLICATLPTAFWLNLQASLEPQSGSVVVLVLQAQATIDTDALGVPAVRAGSAADAYRALGYLHARDRLFQMELARRNTAGTLAEILGTALTDTDRRHRVLGLAHVAEQVIARLDTRQTQYLEAYAQGVNAYLGEAHPLPPEFRLLRHRPRPWAPRDSVLVMLGMFETLAWREDEERMLSVMAASLPREVVEFLTPDTDPYTNRWFPQAPARHPQGPIPIAKLIQLIDLNRSFSSKALDWVETPHSAIGSNAWVVSGGRSYDGRALLANDMHLKLGLPNIWYRAQLHYGERMLVGVTLPGVPGIVAGSSGKVAWGFTNAYADLLDLVKIESNPANPNQYRTAQGWQTFAKRRERIEVRDTAPVELEVRTTIWGPVSEKKLLDHEVAIHWTALDPGAVDLHLLDMDQPQSAAEALAVLNRAGMPPQNAVVADDQGHIGWTYSGRIPKRRANDGSISQSWADDTQAWDGYIAPQELPRVLDPPEGFIASANNRRVGSDYPHTIGRAYASGYRVHRISEVLSTKTSVREADMLALQLDTQTDFYKNYHRVAKNAVGEAQYANNPQWQEIRETLASWNGHADRDSRGLALLTRFRERLMAAVLGPLTRASHERDPGFVYRWNFADAPLQALLTEQPAALAPLIAPGASWKALIAEQLAGAAADLKSTYQTDLRQLRWGMTNRYSVAHPMSRAIAWLGPWLNMPEREIPGCGMCVRVYFNGEAASERLVVAPGHEQDGIFHMPGGQSGNPFSEHYGDQQPAWIEGLAAPLLPGPTVRTLSLEPR